MAKNCCAGKSVKSIAEAGARRKAPPGAAFGLDGALQTTVFCGIIPIYSTRFQAMPQTLYDKLWASHVVHAEDDGTALLYIDRHLVHEVTSPQAFEGLRLAGRRPWRIDSIVA